MSHSQLFAGRNITIFDRKGFSTSTLGLVVLAIAVVVGLVFRSSIQQYLSRTSLAREFQAIAAEELRAKANGDKFLECTDAKICPEMTILPPGTFEMGDHGAFPNAPELPTHEIQIDYRFAVSTFELSMSQWQACESLPAPRSGIRCHSMDYGTRPDDAPATGISWHDAQVYVAWLNHTLGFGDQGGPYRLLSEAEWEYAVRADPGDRGSHPDYFWGSSLELACEYANVVNPETRMTHPHFNWPTLACDDNFVDLAPNGSFKPNQFGLFDMAGNVAEWVQDCWHDDYDYESRPDDGSAWTEEAPANCYRVIRGGSWSGMIDKLRSSARSRAEPHSRGDNVGLRIARRLD